MTLASMRNERATYYKRRMKELEKNLADTKKALAPFAKVWKEFEKLDQSTTSNTVLHAKAIHFYMAAKCLDKEEP